MAVLAFIVVSVSTPISRWQAFVAYFAAIFAVSLDCKDSNADPAYTFID